MKLHELTIIVVLCSLVVLGAVGFVTDLGVEYGGEADFSGLNYTNASLSKMNGVADDLQEEIANFVPETGTEVLLIPYTFLKVAWKSAKLMFLSWTTLGGIMGDLSTTTTENGIPLPSYLLPALVSIVIFILAGIIIYSFFKWKFED